jgi:hypothetical protein
VGVGVGWGFLRRPGGAGVMVNGVSISFLVVVALLVHNIVPRITQNESTVRPANHVFDLDAGFLRRPCYLDDRVSSILTYRTRACIFLPQKIKVLLMVSSAIIKLRGYCLNRPVLFFIPAGCGFNQ